MPFKRGLLKRLAALAVTAGLMGAMAAAQTPPHQPEPEQPAQSQPPPGEPSAAAGNISSDEGLKVEEIHLSGVTRADAVAKLRALIVQHENEPLARENIRQSMKALYETGRFADIRVEAEHAAGGGIILDFVTEPNYFIGGVTVEGNPAQPTASQVANVCKLQLGELFTQEKLENGLKNVKQLMAENGYYRYSVKDEERRHPETQQVDILLRLSVGQRAHAGRVMFSGDGRYSEGQLQDVAHLHPGDPVSSQRITDALQHLSKNYQKQNRWLAQVTVADRTYRQAANAVDYSINLDPGPTVQISTEGYKISERVLKRLVPVYQEDALDDDLLNEGRRNLLNYLQARGYFDAKVDLRRHHSADRKQLQVLYVIEPGDRHRLVSIEIAGNKYFTTEILRSHMQVQTTGRLLMPGVYSQRLLSSDVEALENLYRANGFSAVKITSAIADDYQGRHDQIAITLQVDEGPQTLVGKLHIVGNKVIEESKLRENINISEGQPFSDFYVAEDRDNVLNYYFNRGFPDATFEAAARPDPTVPNRMDVTYTIHEGRQVFVHEVMLSGAEFTKPYIMQRELQVKPGDPLSQLDMLNTQQALYGLGIFNQVDTAVQDPEGNEAEKNVLVQVQEARRYTFSYGLGFEFQTGQPSIGTNVAQGSTGVSPRVSFSVSRLNLRGRDQTLTFSANAGELQQRGLISYTAPRLLNNPKWKLIFTSFYDDTVDVTTFRSERLEGSIEADQKIGRMSTEEQATGTSMAYRFTYRRVLASDVQISTDEIPLLSLPTRVGGPGFTYIRDKRDNALESTKGNYTTVDSFVASSHFGSEADFSRFIIQNSTYYAFGKNRRPGKKFVFARSTQVGLENTFSNTINVAPGETVPAGDSLVPLPERLFSGGGNSHRGFGLNQAGPRDPLTGFPLGGSALFVNNLELRLPPLTLPFVGDNVSLAVFHDAGNVFVNGNDMVHSLLRWHQRDPALCEQESTAKQCDYSYISQAIGVGVHYKTPIGPVRFDFGYNLNPPAFPSCQTSMGTPAGSNCPVDTVFAPQHVRHFNVFFSIGQTF